ncbi:MAG: aminotransferase class V-fold PLP-dependent enzyme [Verrucomicrobiae bacterium]|nr:aminotransferase class V-fold PLP-dependent enzyme [Verrucomicrobiae bacterium]
MRDRFTLDPTVTFLNHGSFGACPRAVQEAQQAWRQRLEAEPVLFLARELEPLLDHARSVLADFLHADPDDLAFIPNATSGVNTVLRSLAFEPGDELLVTNHAYNACAAALAYTAQRNRARVVVAPVPFPGTTPEQVAAAILDAVTPRTRLALLDHVTSPTGLVLPIEPLVSQLESRGIPTLVDGAHAPGMVPVHLHRLGASYYTGNLHKWVCAPKGSAFLHVRRDRQPDIHPLTLSHGYNSPRTDRSRFQLEFAWTGTLDPSPWLAVPAAIETVHAMHPDGWEGVARANRDLALAGRQLLLDALEVPAPCPETMIGSLATVPLPPALFPPLPAPFAPDPLQTRLFDRHRIEVPCLTFTGRRCLRISTHRYNTLDDIRQLAAALRA